MALLIGSAMQPEYLSRAVVGWSVWPTSGTGPLDGAVAEIQPLLERFGSISATLYDVGFAREFGRWNHPLPDAGSK